MPSFGGFLGGAGTGASLGSMFGPIGTGIGAIGGGLIGLFTGGKSRLQKQMENKINPGLENLMNWSGQARDTSMAYTGKAMPAFDKALNFYGGILDPNSTRGLDAALGSSRTALADQTRNIINQIGTGPRGGGTNEMTGQALWNQNRQLLEMVPQLRGMAAEHISQIAQVLSNMGLNFSQLSAQEQEGVLSAIQGLSTGVANQQYMQQKQTGQIAQQLGTMLGPFIGRISGGRFGTPSAVGPAGSLQPGDFGRD